MQYNNYNQYLSLVMIVVMAIYAALVYTFGNPPRNKKSKTNTDMEIKKYDVIIKEANSIEGKEAKNKAVNKTVKIKAATQLQNKVGSAKLEQLNAQDSFESAVVSGNEIPEKALLLKKANETYSFYKELYDGLFGGDDDLK